jgi:hypothetical protein
LKKPLLFLGKLIVTSLLLLPLFNLFDEAYFAFCLFGIPLNLRGNTYVSSSMVYPFTVLILVTPKVSLARKAVGIAASIFLAFLMDRFMFAMWGIYPFAPRANQSHYHVWAYDIWYVAIRWMLPVLLWLIVAYRQIGDMFRDVTGKDRPPQCRDGHASQGSAS